MTELSTTAGMGHRRHRNPRPIGHPWLSDRATTLVLVPAMMIVFIALAGIAVDLSAMHLAHRRAHAVVSVAADDAAGMLDERTLQVDGRPRIDPERAARVALAHVSAARLPGSVVAGPTVTIGPDGRQITITVKLRIEHIFLRSIPSFTSEVLSITASARLTV